MNTTIVDKLTMFKSLWEKAAQSASASFSKLVGHESFINISETITTDPMSLYKQFGNPDSNVFATVLRIDGDLDGYILVIWPTDQAMRMAKEMTKIESQGSDLSELERSALQEVANIVTSAFLTEINGFSKLKILQSIPESRADMLKAILDEISADVAQNSANILMLSTQLEILPINAAAFFSIVLDAKSGKKLLETFSNE